MNHSLGNVFFWLSQHILLYRCGRWIFSSWVFCSSHLLRSCTCAYAEHFYSFKVLLFIKKSILNNALRALFLHTLKCLPLLSPVHFTFLHCFSLPGFYFRRLFSFPCHFTHVYIFIFLCILKFVSDWISCYCL